MTQLEATETEIMGTVSAYLMVSGAMPLLWGPFSDRFGRKTAFVISTIIFTAFSLAAAFAWNVSSLLAFRVMAAVGASSTLTVGAGAIADTHHPSVRGKAMGYFLLGPLLGPIIGPIVGGLLSERFGWPSIFFFLASLGAIAIPCLILFLPETLPKVAPGTKRPFPRPWAAFKFLASPGILAVTVMAAFSYGCFYVAVITFPVVMAARFNMPCVPPLPFIMFFFFTPLGFALIEPFSSHFRVSTIGFYMIIQGVGTMMGSVIGGRIADYSARGKTVSYRLVSTV